jgi:uncharacterized protein (UPF0332 family)
VTGDDKKGALAQYRLQQARESLEEARYLLSGGRSLRSVVNRLYYGMFYSVLALLIYGPYASSKHSGVLYEAAQFIHSVSTFLDETLAAKQRG